MRRMRTGAGRRLTAIVALLGLAGAAVYAALPSGQSAQMQYETAPVTRGALAARVIATGTLSPLVTVLVGSQVSGRIQALYADFNSRVAKGQIIARIDPSLFESDVANARANLQAAEAEVDRAEAELADAKRSNERAQALVAKRMIAQAEADTAATAFQAAEAGLASAGATLAQANAELARAETNLAYTEIVSPIDGVVISRSVDVGQTVAASLQTPTLFTIAEDLRQMEVHTNVAESDIGRIETGMAIEFTVDAYPQERFPGVVKQVRYAAQTIQNVVTYDAVISVANQDLKLRPGMTADVTFVVDERDDALIVPSAALRFRPPATAGSPSNGSPPATSPGERVVWTLGDDGQPRPVVVEVGITDGRQAEILGGRLSAGDHVIVGVSGSQGPASQEPQSRFGRFL
jgi:HlyD family secretion protein